MVWIVPQSTGVSCCCARRTGRILRHPTCVLCLVPSSRQLPEVLHFTVCRKLLGDLTSIVSNRKATGRDVATAVRGIGELAAPTLKFYGQEVFPRRLLLSIERHFRHIGHGSIKTG